ncbi:hypothetical protein J6590_034306 [Homalodisca vitripennis]|nr:hypothetical protein J6590_034306 [Homalodisca vitripennis]
MRILGIDDYILRYKKPDPLIVPYPVSVLCLDICKYYLRLGLIVYLLGYLSALGQNECVTIMDQPSTSSTNHSELVCRKYYLRLGLILLSERSGAEVSASLDIVYCSLDRVNA